MLRSSSALLRPGTQTRPQVVQLLPSPRPITPQRGETCRRTLPIGMLVEGRHTHIAVAVNSTRTHECVQHSPTPSFTVSWHNAWLYRGMAKRAQLAAYALQGWNKPWPQYGTWNMEHQKDVLKVYWKQTAQDVTVSQTVLINYYQAMPSVLWHCWLGDRKGIRHLACRNLALAIPKGFFLFRWPSSYLRKNSPVKPKPKE